MGPVGARVARRGRSLTRSGGRTGSMAGGDEAVKPVVVRAVGLDRGLVPEACTPVAMRRCQCGGSAFVLDGASVVEGPMGSSGVVSRDPAGTAKRSSRGFGQCLAPCSVPRNDGWARAGWRVEAAELPVWGTVRLGTTGVNWASNRNLSAGEVHRKR